MELRVFTEPQLGASYDTLVTVARAAEDLSFGAFFRSDHVLTMGGGDGLPGPTDAWVTLAGLARETRRIRLGTLVTSATFRLPGMLAIAVAQVDQMSGGRVELGLGAGWYEDEHRAYGIPFPDVGERFDRLAEQLAVVHGLWTTASGQTFGFTGQHYRLADSPALPKPVQRPHPPLIVGGTGARRTPALAARYADEVNVPFADVRTTARQFDRTRAACQAVGRDPDALIRSHAITLCCGRDDSEVRRRAEAIGRSVDQLAGAAVGTPGQVVDILGGYREAGASRSYLQMLDLDDIEHLALVAAEVMPQLAG